jgi:hypothetical protein
MSSVGENFIQQVKRQQGVKIGGFFAQLSPPPALRPHFRREIRSIVAATDKFSLVGGAVGTSVLFADTSR